MGLEPYAGTSDNDRTLARSEISRAEEEVREAEAVLNEAKQKRATIIVGDLKRSIAEDLRHLPHIAEARADGHRTFEDFEKGVKAKVDAVAHYVNRYGGFVDGLLEKVQTEVAEAFDPYRPKPVRKS